MKIVPIGVRPVDFSVNEGRFVFLDRPDNRALLTHYPGA